MESNKKTRMKINAFDVFLVFLVLCLVLTFGFRIYQGVAEDKKSHDAEYSVSFKCEGEYDIILNSIKEGDAVYLESGELLGYMISTNYDSAPAPDAPEAPEEEGTTKLPSDATELKVITFTGELKLNGNAKRIESGDYYSIGDDNVTVGSRITVHTENAEFTVTIVAIEKVDKY